MSRPQKYNETRETIRSAACIAAITIGWASAFIAFDWYFLAH